MPKSRIYDFGCPIDFSSIEPFKLTKTCPNFIMFFSRTALMFTFIWGHIGIGRYRFIGHPVHFDRFFTERHETKPDAI